MALIVEDGTGVAGADSYDSLANIIAYVTAYYGSTDPFIALATADQEIAARRSTQFLDLEYEPSMSGIRVDLAQALAWPRSGAVSAVRGSILTTVVPLELQRAEAEAARRLSLGEDLLGDLFRGGAVQSEQVDVLRVAYFSGAAGETVYRQIDELMRQFRAAGTSENSVRMTRS